MTNTHQSKPAFVKADTKLILNGAYQEWLSDIKQRLKRSQAKAAVRVNTTLLEFYWSLGRDLVKLKAEQAWGSGVVEQLSIDLKKEFPHLSGFSVSNIKYTRQWYLFYYEFLIKSQQLVGELEMPDKFGLIPWGHHIQIISKSESVKEALFYIDKTIEEAWSRQQLVEEIKNKLYSRSGKALTNFAEKLPAAQNKLAQELLKDPHNFDFLTLSSDYKERDLEDGLSEQITRFLLELGSGFAFVGRQMELRMPSGQTFYPDMIFYHIKLKAYVIIELKIVDFIPEFAGKLNFYVSAADHLLRGEGDNPSIGLLICRAKDETVVQWSLEGIEKPIGVSTYELQTLVNNAIKQLDNKP